MAKIEIIPKDEITKADRERYNSSVMDELYFEGLRMCKALDIGAESGSQTKVAVRDSAGGILTELDANDIISNKGKNKVRDAILAVRKSLDYQLMKMKGRNRVIIESNTDAEKTRDKA